MANDSDLTKSTLLAVWKLIGSAKDSSQISNYEMMDTETFDELAKTVDNLVQSSDALGLQDTVLAVTDQLFDQGIDRLAGSMISDGQDSEQVFDFQSFNIAIQKKSQH